MSDRSTVPPASARRLLMVLVFTSLSTTPGGPASAGAAPAQQRPASEAPVTTRAIVRSVFTEDDGRRTYIRLKLVPRGKLPFTTLTFRVPDRRLIAGLEEGASVAFVAQRIGGENTLTAIRAVPPCERFQPCQ